MMAKMRSLAPWFIISVGGLFVLFMVLSDAKITQMIGGRSNNVGSINGQDITYQQFSATVERLRTQQEQRNNVQIDETQMDAFRDQVWDLMVDQTLLKQKVKQLGIEISDDEIRSVVLGDNPPDYLKSNFIDSTGNFNREQYETAIFDPRNKEILLQVEDQIRSQKTQEKLQSLVNASISVSEDEILTDYQDNNTKMSAVYAMVDANTIADSLIQVSDDDLQEYYSDNQDDFKIKEQRTLKYVIFRKQPSKGDSTGIVNNLNSIVEKLKDDTSTFQTYVEIYSDEPYSVDTAEISSLPKDAVQLLLNAKKNEFVGPVLSGDNYVLYKLLNRFNGEKTYVRAQHILIRAQGNEDSVKAVVDGLYERLIAGEDFAELAKEYSQDPSNAPLGGDLGWFGKGAMVKEFEDAAFNGKIGVVQKPIKTRFGFHIIKVNAKSNQEIVVEKIVNKIQASPTTVDKIYNRASDFSYLANKNSFESEANLMKYQISETPAFDEAAKSIPGLGSNRAMIRFAFDNSIGDVSDVFRIAAGYAVVTPFTEISEGYRPFEEVKATIETRVKREKKLDKSFEIIREISAKLNGTDNFSIARSVFPKVKVSAASDITPKGNVQGIGRDYAFNQYAMNGELNAVSAPIKGTRGSYLIKITRRTDFNQQDYDSKRTGIRDRLLTQKKSNAFRQWLASLREEADIDDNRHLFYK